jgi:hypothetical protein
MNLSAATGGLTTLGISAYGVKGGDDASTDIDLTARFDNLVIESKPDGAAVFTRIYANDFASRTITRAVPDPLEFGYANDTAALNGSYWYTPWDNLTRDNKLEYPNGSILGSGMDGWIRRNTGNGELTVARTASDANMYASAWTYNGDNFISPASGSQHLDERHAQVTVK